MLLVHTPGNGFAHYECAVTLYGEDYAKGHMSRILAGDADGFSCPGCLELLGENEPERTPSPELNAPPAAKRDGASLALALAGTLSLGLPDPDYITMHPDLAGSTTSSAAGFQFNDRHGQDPLPAMHAWASRFGVTVDVSPVAANPAATWHQFDFTHAGVRIHAYAEIAAAAPAIDSEAWKCAGCGAQCIAGRPADDLCRDCAGRVLAASIASGQPLTVAGDEPPCGLRLWGDTSLCELPAGHDPLPACKGTPRPFARTTAAPAAPSAAEVANAFNAQYGVPAPFPPATDPAEAADPGYLEDAAARDDDEAGDPFLGHAPSGMQGPAPVARVLDDGERPATWMACGDSLEDDQPHEPGSPAECPRHGQTYFISEAQWLARVPPEHGGQLPRRVVSLDSRMGFVSRLDGAKVRTGGEL
jgi:hypothetical protein